MELISDEELAAALTQVGIERDSTYPDWLTQMPENHSRFWLLPRYGHGSGWLAEGLLRYVIDPWESIVFLPKRGSWSVREEFRRGPAGCWETLVRALGVPGDHAGAVRLARDEMRSAVALLFLHCELVDALIDDLWIVPDHGRQLLYVEHHVFVWIHTKTEGEIDEVVARMARGGHELPTELPDETFRPVPWMPNGGVPPGGRSGPPVR